LHFWGEDILKTRAIRLIYAIILMMALFVTTTAAGVRPAAAAGPICVIPTDYATVTLALADAGCTTIQVPGAITEAFVVTRGVIIDGLATGTINAPAGTLNLEPQSLGPPPQQYASIISIRGAGITATIQNLTINGNGSGPATCDPVFVGIAVRDGATANITNNTIKNIVPQVVAQPCNSGLAIVVGRVSWNSSGTANILNNIFTNYEKNAITVLNNSQVTINGNTITGRGLFAGDIVAQNGIQLGDLAPGPANSQANAINNNIITQNIYAGTGGDNALANGIQIDNASNVAITGNNLDSNQINLYSNASLGNVTGNCITNSTGPRGTDPYAIPAGLYADSSTGDNTGTPSNINAINNWWGSTDGPSFINNPAGRGDRITLAYNSTVNAVPFTAVIPAVPKGCLNESALNTQTPTSTATPTTTLSPTVTSSSTGTSSPTVTSSPSGTSSPSATSSVTATPSTTVTPSVTPTVSITPTSSTTSTLNGSVTATNTSSATVTGTPPTSTPTSSATVTGTLPTNTATATGPTSTATVTGTLPTNTATSQSQATNTPGGPNLSFADPAINKTGNPSLAQPGDTVTFTIVVSNNGTVAAQNVTVTDPINPPLTYVSASTQQGSYTVNGSTVTFNVGTVNPGQLIALTVIVKVSASATTPLDITNTATLNNNGKTSSATIHLTSGRLPSTGEHPAESSFDGGWLMVLAGLFVAGGLGFGGYTIVRRQSNR